MSHVQIVRDGERERGMGMGERERKKENPRPPEIVFHVTRLAADVIASD